jgi:hypothetical protein
MAQLRRIIIDVTIVSFLLEGWSQIFGRRLHVTGHTTAVRTNNISGLSEMVDFDVEAFIAKLDGMGMKLTAIPLADGRFRVSRWCMMTANEHAQQIDDLWTKLIGDDQERIDVLAAHLAKTAPPTARYVISSVPRVASQSIAMPGGAPGLDA